LLPSRSDRFIRRLSGPQFRSGSSDEEKKKSLHSPCRKSNPDYLARNLVTVLTELTWFLKLIINKTMVRISLILYSYAVTLVIQHVTD